METLPVSKPYYFVMDNSSENEATVTLIGKTATFCKDVCKNDVLCGHSIKRGHIWKVNSNVWHQIPLWISLFFFFLRCLTEFFFNVKTKWKHMWKIFTFSFYLRIYLGNFKIAFLDNSSLIPVNCLTIYLRWPMLCRHIPDDLGSM